jgi:2-dehydro-3-deoxyphosphogluconate aldolase/(4S)-4-hydroxy-2-oxoglutarate aldolase
MDVKKGDTNMIELMNDILKVTGICPIIAYAEPDQAVPAAKALVTGGLPVVELLLRNDHALDNIANIAKNVPEIIVGAGTVVSVQQAEKAIGQGAQFIVMPGFGRQVVEYCLKKNVPVIPGCITPGELTTALEYGINVVKFFPVYQLGGLEMINQLCGAYPTIRYVVTGALNETNFLPLLKNPNVLACGGDWMFTQGRALVNRDYDLIAKNLRNSIYQAQDLRNSMAIQE